VYFNLTGNSGAAFSMLPGRNILLIWASVIALGAILFFSEKISKDRCLSIFVGLIAGGILGNLYDRIVYGFVVDFIDLGIWPVFNIADSCITIGAIGLAIILLRRSN
ncbi:signal peptidase II, partial [Candidatus Woesearchaeota archaeon CG10_big_fil_rev_8_21_14_0_10_45_5]